MINRQFFIVAGIVITVCILLVIGLFTRQSNPDKPPEVPTPPSNSHAQPTKEEPHADHTDHIEDDLFVDNFSQVEEVFNEDQFHFINDRIREYAQNNHPQSVVSLKVDEATFTKRDATSYGFSIVNAENTHLFYVIATQLPDNAVKVDLYAS